MDRSHKFDIIGYCNVFQDVQTKLSRMPLKLNNIVNILYIKSSVYERDMSITY